MGVVVTVDVKCKVCGINDKTDPQNRPPREGSQHFRDIKFQTKEIDEEEWEWRLMWASWLLYYGVDMFL